MKVLKWVLIGVAGLIAINVGVVAAGMLAGYLSYRTSHATPAPTVHIVYCGGPGMPACAAPRASSASSPAAAAPSL